MYTDSHICKLITVNDESLMGLKFAESAKKSIWLKKILRIHSQLQVCSYNIGLTYGK